MIDNIKTWCRNKWQTHQANKKKKAEERHHIRQLFIYYKDLNYGTTMWQTNQQGDRVRNKHKWY